MAQRLELEYRNLPTEVTSSYVKWTDTVLSCCNVLSALPPGDKRDSHLLALDHLMSLGEFYDSVPSQYRADLQGRSADALAAARSNSSMVSQIQEAGKVYEWRHHMPGDRN